MWEHRGYCGHGCEELLGSLAGVPAIIAGNGKGVFEEVRAAESMLSGPLIFAVNDVSVLLPHIDHMVSLHTPKLALWAELRHDPTSKGYGNKDFRVHDAGLYGERAWHQWQHLTPLMALSGYFAAQVAYLMGCEPIVLCGCPGDGAPRFWEMTTDSYDYSRQAEPFAQEMNYRPDFKKALRSMSGWTREFLGAL